MLFGVEAFFVVVMIAVLLGVAAWAVTAVTKLRTFSDRRTGEE